VSATLRGARPRYVSTVAILAQGTIQRYGSSAGLFASGARGAIINSEKLPHG
jgi:hypothetical protein